MGIKIINLTKSEKISHIFNNKNISAIEMDGNNNWAVITNYNIVYIIRGTMGMVFKEGTQIEFR